LQIVVVALIAAVLLGIAIALGLLTGGRRFF
jgi:phosphate/sulfate permease